MNNGRIHKKQRPSEIYSDGLCFQVALSLSSSGVLMRGDFLEFYEAYFFAFLAGAALAAGSEAAASGAAVSGAATGSDAAGSEAADSAVR